MEDKIIRFSPQAVETIGNIAEACFDLGQYYGENSDEYRKALKSAFGCLLQMIRLGGRVMSEGPVTLICQQDNDGIVYGINPSYGPKVAGLEAVTWSVNS